MNKKLVSGLAIIILIAQIFSLVNVPIVEALERSFVDAQATIGTNHQNYLLYFTDPINRWFYFYYESDTKIMWRWSIDGTAWSVQYEFQLAPAFIPSGMDVCKGINGDIHIVLYRLNAAGSNDYIYYINAEPQKNGNCTFGSLWYVATINDPNIASRWRIEVDSNNYAWIGYSVFGGVTAQPYLLVNGQNDGTWSTNFSGQPEVNAGDIWTVLPMRLKDGKMMIISAEGGSRRIRFRLWLGNGTGWNQTCKNLSKYNIHNAYKIDADSLGDRVYMYYINETDFNLRYCEWNGQLTPNAGWSDIKTDTVVDTNSYPNVAKIRGQDISIVTWMEKRSAGGGRCIYYQTNNNGTFLLNPALWYNETGNTVDVVSKGINKRIRMKLNKDWVGLAYIRTSGSPVGRWFASLGSIELGYPPDAPFLMPNSTFLDTDEGYLFEKEVYRLRATFNNTHIAKMNFTDGEHEIRFEYNNETKSMTVSSDEDFVVGGIWTNFTVSGSFVTLKWRFQINKNIRDIRNTTMQWYAYDRLGNSTFGFVDIQPFHIYNLGGYANYRFGGDGRRLPYGHTFDLVAKDGATNSYAYAEQVYRRLQHTHFLVELDFGNDWNAGNNELDIYGGHGYFEFGFDYMVNGSWVEGWKVRTYIQNGDVGHHAGGNDHSWMEMVVDWYNRGTQNKTTYLYTYHWGYDFDDVGGLGYSNRTSTQLWIDLWFPREEESTKVGGHYNSYWNGMYENGNPFWFGYGNFMPMVGNRTESLFMDYLYNGSSVAGFKKKEESVITTRDLEVVRIWVRVAKLNFAASNDDPYKIRIHEYDKTQADDKFEGIDRPQFIETTDPSMPNVGGFNPITKLLSMLGTYITNGLINAWKTLWGAMDSFMRWILPYNIWDRMIEFISYVVRLVSLGLTQIPTMIGNMVAVLTDQFGFIIVFVPRYLIFLGQFASSMIMWWNYFIQLMTGQLTGFNNIYELLAVEQWFLLFINLFPIWEFFFRILPSNDPMKTAKEDVNFFMSLFSRVFDFGKTLFDIIISVFNFIRNLLPF